MYLEDVKDINEVLLAKGTVLVEFIATEKEKDEEDKDNDNIELLIEKEVIIKSEAERIEVGDIVLDARYPILDGNKGTYYYEAGDRKFAVIMAHDIKMWTKPNNFNK